MTKWLQRRLAAHVGTAVKTTPCFGTAAAYFPASQTAQSYTKDVFLIREIEHTDLLGLFILAAWPSFDLLPNSSSSDFAPLFWFLIMLCAEAAKWLRHRGLARGQGEWSEPQSLYQHLKLQAYYSVDNLKGTLQPK